MSAEPEKTANVAEEDVNQAADRSAAGQEGSPAPEADAADAQADSTESAASPHVLEPPATAEPSATSEPPNKSGEGYNVSLPTFEGPLDLLLHLIRQHELDIRDIPIAFISEKYVEYIMLMQELNIDLASEYLVMAATLAHIKSKMLLPAPPSDQEDESAEDFDPRSDLVRRLLEYQKYKNAAAQLGSAPVLGRDVFLRGVAAPEVDGPAPLAQVSVFKLFDAFQRVLGRIKQTADHQIDVDRISISERILQLTDLLKERGRTEFEELFEGQVARSDLVVTFLALLEMTRLRMLQVFQEASLSPIYVELTLTDEHDEVLRQKEQGDDPLAMLEAEAAGDDSTRTDSSQESTDFEKDD